MRCAGRVAADFDDGLKHRRTDGRRQCAAIVDVALDATAGDELGSESADLLGKNRVARLGVGTISEIRVMQTPPEHEWLGAHWCDVSRRLLEAVVRLVGILIGQRGLATEPRCFRQWKGI